MLKAAHSVLILCTTIRKINYIIKMLNKADSSEYDWHADEIRL